jgi:hypothetical protein
MQHPWLKKHIFAKITKTMAVIEYLLSGSEGSRDLPKSREKALYRD